MVYLYMPKTQLVIIKAIPFNSSHPSPPPLPPPLPPSHTHTHYRTWFLPFEKSPKVPTHTTFLNVQRKLCPVLQPRTRGVCYWGIELFLLELKFFGGIQISEELYAFLLVRLFTLSFSSLLLHFREREFSPNSSKQFQRSNIPMQ